MPAYLIFYFVSVESVYPIRFISTLIWAIRISGLIRSADTHIQCYKGVGCCNIHMFVLASMMSVGAGVCSAHTQ